VGSLESKAIETTHLGSGNLALVLGHMKKHNGQAKGGCFEGYSL